MKVWVDNELIDDGDMNYIGSRLVHRYNSEADRNAGIPTPSTGSMAYVSDLGMTMYSGGAWKLVALTALSGTATLVAGTVVVNTTAVTAVSRIHLAVQSLGTVTVPSALAVSARTPGTSFTILASQATDTSNVAWQLMEP